MSIKGPALAAALALVSGCASTPDEQPSPTETQTKVLCIEGSVSPKYRNPPPVVLAAVACGSFPENVAEQIETNKCPDKFGALFRELLDASHRSSLGQQGTKKDRNRYRDLRKEFDGGPCGALFSLGTNVDVCLVFGLSTGGETERECKPLSNLKNPHPEQNR